MATNKGKYVLIEKSRHLISINEIKTPATSLESNGYELLPGFNESGESFLYEALKRSNNQGTAIKAIETAYVQLQIHDEPDINWLDWLKKHFEPKQHGNLWNKKVKRAACINTLYDLLDHSNIEDPTMADIIMLGQLQDCCDQLGIHRLIQTSLHKKISNE